MYKAINAEARATLCVMKNLRIGENKIRTEGGREREIGTKNKLYSRRQQLQMTTTTTTTLLKVTKSLYIVTHLGQLPFMLFT